MRTVEEWMVRLNEKTLEWLENQKHPCVRGYNGTEYDTAIDRLINTRKDAGEYVERHRPTFIIPTDELDEKNVEIISYGGKGGTMRIVHPN